MPSLLNSIRYYLFCTVEWVIERIQRIPRTRLQHYIPTLQEKLGIVRPYLWVFASTIGELHAIRPLLIRYLSKHKSDGLVILTDHPHYTNAFLGAFPQAVIIDHGLHGRISDQLDRFIPNLLLIAEIPCLLADAPCRFSYRVVREFKRRNVPVVAVNGWLYGEEPSCRMDAFEAGLFQNDYINAIDWFTVQTEDVRDQLQKLGVDSKKIVVAGNIKFDSLNPDSQQLAPPTVLTPIINEIRDSGRNVITAGCVTNISEQEFLLDAYCEVIKRIPDALLILAPRHPENQDRMIKLEQLLNDRSLKYIMRSHYAEGMLQAATVLVLDTIGELKYLYAVADVCFVGVNHNVLEPLSVNKPVIVSSDWDRRYPSYPVYKISKKMSLVEEVVDYADLSDSIVQKIYELPKCYYPQAPKNLKNLQGATKKNIELINLILPK